VVETYELGLLRLLLRWIHEYFSGLSIQFIALELDNFINWETSVQIRSKAPLRIGFAGGGTDISPYSDEFGGAILNATISLSAHVYIKPRADKRIIIESVEYNEREEFDNLKELPTAGKLALAKGVYNRIVKQFAKEALGFELVSYVDAPAGSGLGTSSTLVVALIGAFAEWLNLPLGEYDIAQLAYDIERVDLGLAGGKQDQYAATFGGVNFMEFQKDKVIVNPLRVRKDVLNELESTLILYFTSTTRESAKLIDEQSKNVRTHVQSSMDAAHELKKQAFQMKEAILLKDLASIGRILDFGWQQKKRLSGGVTTAHMDQLYTAATAAGAKGGKVTGAGGGGFMVFYCPEASRYNVIRALKEFGGEVRPFQFTELGLTTWKTQGQ
jgi:D-glycero-alpha-D-manno-heptose-7-phosphate kinase